MHELSVNTSHFLLLMFVCTILPSPLVGKGWMKQNTASTISSLSLSLSLSLSRKTTIVEGRPKEDILDFRENRHNSSLLCTVSGHKQPRAHYTRCSSGLPADRPVIGIGGSGPARRARRPASISQVTPEKKLSLFP